MMKKIFKAVVADGREGLKNMRPLIEMFMAVMITGIPSFQITKVITEDVEMAGGVAGISAVIGIVLLFLYDHYKDAVEYSKRNNVNLKRAWKRTARSFYDDEGDYDKEDENLLS